MSYYLHLYLLTLSDSQRDTLEAPEEKEKKKMRERQRERMCARRRKCVREREIKSEEGKMSLNGFYEEIT